MDFDNLLHALLTLFALMISGKEHVITIKGF